MISHKLEITKSFGEGSNDLEEWKRSVALRTARKGLCSLAWTFRSNLVENGRNYWIWSGSYDGCLVMMLQRTGFTNLLLLLIVCVTYDHEIIFWEE